MKLQYAIALLLLAGIIGLALLIYGSRDLVRANDWARLLQALFTVGAFSLAAYWYFAERKGMPHADVAQTVQAIPLGSSTPSERRIVAIEANVTIRNLGQRLLMINEVQSYLQDVELDSYDYARLSSLPPSEYWTARRPDGSNQFLDSELRWPLLHKFENEVSHRIEPGETDLLVVTFLVDCAQVQNWVRVATDIIHPGAGAERSAWKARNFVDLREACSQ